MRYNTNKWLMVLAGLVFGMHLQAQSVCYTREDSLSVVALLKKGSTNPLVYARSFIGVPYVAHTLEVNDDERLVVNLRELDCTTLVENVAALTLCARTGKTTFKDFTDMLTMLRYRHGRIDGYPSRLHYFSDWIFDNTKKGLVSDIVVNPPFSGIQKLRLNYMSTHPQAYKALKNHPELVTTIAAQERHITGKTIRYIPKSKIRNTKLMRQTVKDGDIIAITCNKKGLDIAHLGFAVWQKDGLHLLNASSIYHKVVEDTTPLRQYMKQHPSFTGIKILRLRTSKKQ